MRKLVIGMALASTALATPALARDGQWYIEAQGGPMLVEDTDVSIVNSITGATGDATVEYDEGGDFGAVVGHDFGAFRLEAEASYRTADIDGFTVDGIGFPIVSNTGQTIVIPGDRFDTPQSEVDALSFMLNGLFDFGPDDGLQAFAGAGIGVARTQYEIPTGFDDSNTGLAWQILAGVRAPITENIDAGLRYRMFTAEDIDFVDVAGRDNEAKLRSHSLMGTFTLNFGGPDPIATQTCYDGSVIPVTEACPARPTPPPAVQNKTCADGSVIPVTATCPAPAAVCRQGPYIVFFEWDQSDITAEAAGILNNAVSAYSSCGTAAVMLAGHTDTSGSRAYNDGLAQRRNASVRSYLAGRGIPDTRISSEAFGESQLRVPTADGVRELQNRRVEVSYGPNAGM
ncbi:MAG: OmpA family protein [Parerythrobacter sp.]